MSTSISVLVVDDDTSIAKILAAILNVKGFEVTAANSGRDALEILHGHPVNILLTDIKMQAMNGVELCREARKIQPNIAQILMTAYSADDLIQQGMAEGIKTVLTKPVDIDFLVSYLFTTQRLLIKN